jgi:AmpE protein
MGTALVAVVLAVVLGHTMPALAQIRRFEWFAAWQQWIGGRLNSEPGNSLSGVLVVVLPPVLLLAALQLLLAPILFGLPALLLALAVLIACWGPRDLDRDVDALVQSESAAEIDQAARMLSPQIAEPDTGGPALVDAVFRAALHRWFGVLLWFMLLGPAGALFYRLAQLADDNSPPSDQETPLGVLRLVLEWPTAQLMTLALALAASFDAVLNAWRDWHLQRNSWLVADIGFLYAAARASVVMELAEQARDDAAPSADSVAVLPAAGAVRDAMSLVWRILVVWLTLLALLVLAGFG